MDPGRMIQVPDIGWAHRTVYRPCILMDMGEPDYQEYGLGNTCAHSYVVVGREASSGAWHYGLCRERFTEVGTQCLL